ncbi:MAG: hypothetical protein EB078_10255 [Proteobacteria bacterium]|nr:hypothetical protein [Pseudomonadota bacterium]
MVTERALLLFFFFFSVHFLKADFLPPGCQYNKECVVELPGSFCADGTSSYYAVLPQKNTNSIVFFLEPGGACWSKETCNFSHVLSLTRKEHRNKWGKKRGIFNLADAKNPFRNFSIVSIPYCTGDTFLGNNEINYGTDSSPHIVKHHGYKNVLLTFDAVKSIHPNPDKVVLFGMSAGGMGVLGHVRNIDLFFPSAKKFALADAGTPFMPPHIFESAYAEVMDKWNV